MKIEGYLREPLLPMSAEEFNAAKRAFYAKVHTFSSRLLMIEKAEMTTVDAGVSKTVPLWIANGLWDTPGYEVLECYADKFVINDMWTQSDVEVAAFIRRMTDDEIAGLLRMMVGHIETRGQLR